jgi:hypothetical protein
MSLELATPIAGRRSWAWIAVLLAVLAGAAVYFQDLSPSGHAVAYLGIEVAIVAAMLVALATRGIAAPRGWLLIIVGAGMLALGDAIWYWLSFGDGLPSPSIADLFYLAEYPFLAVGALLLVRGRLDRAMLLDSLIVSIAAPWSSGSW